jgi:hypothetical protein
VNELQRYFIPYWHHFFIIGADAICRIKDKFKIKRRYIYILVIIITLVSFTQYTGYRPVPGWALESNLEYQDMIAAHKDAARYLELHHPDDTVLAVFPFVYALSEPRLGYVEHPINVVWYPHAQDIDIVIYQQESQSDIINAYINESVLIQTFKQNGKLIAIYEHKP